jgi:polyisoprenoid-binding protein YceI
MIRRTIFIALGMFLIAGSLLASEWKVDNTHSTIRFTIRHLVVSSVAGSFADFSGTLTWDGAKENMAEGGIELSIAVASISTGNGNRDDHLRTGDFFDVEQYPNITFSGTEVIPGEGDNFQLVGNLTMKGISKEVTFECVFNGQVEHRGRKRSGFSATAVIDRTEFGMEGGSILEGGGLALGNDVTVNMDLAFVGAEEKAEESQAEEKPTE